MAIKILIGGSPCTYWSIAQKNNRETEASGMGWELFKNYLIAKEKFKPDFFLYENNKSAAQAIKDQIAEELGVGVDPDVRFTYINSALVSAQNRQRFYVTNFGEIEQPEDRGILLKDILETGYGFGAMGEKIFALTATYGKGDAPDRILEKHQRTVVAEPVNITDDGKTQTLKAQYHKTSVSNICCYSSTYGATGVAEPVRVGSLPRPNGELSTSQGFRIYSPDGKSVTLKGEVGGAGRKTGLYAFCVGNMYEKQGQNGQLFSLNGKSKTLSAGTGKSGRGIGSNNSPKVVIPVTDAETVQKAIPDIVEKYGYCPEMFNAYNRQEIHDKSPTLSTGSMVSSSCATNKFESICGYAIPCEWDENGRPTKAISCADGKTYTVYEVKDGQITIKDKQYPIKLKDGYYIIRKLTVRECARLQTMPDDYCKAVSDSQGYKALGNGWTAEVIIHLLNHALKDVPRDEEIVVLSMYDGIATGRYCLDKMGFTNVTYHAYENDKYPIQVAMDNYPDIIQHGDAFAVREDDWKPPQTRSEWLDELLGA